MSGATPEPWWWIVLTCREVVELITDYFEGALDPLLHGRVARHIDGCRGCRIYVDQIRTTSAILADLPGTQPSAEVCEELVRAFSSWDASGDSTGRG